jgi:uncharacterized membrane protein
MLGALLALASGACFGLNIAALRRGVLSASVLQAMTITVLFGVPVFVAAAFAFGAWPALAAMQGPALGWMAAAGVVHFIGGRYSDYRATQALGVALSTPVQQTTVAVSLALAVVFLNEQVTGLKLIGLLLMLSGPVALSLRRRQAEAAAATKAFRPSFGPGIFWAAVSALCYGTSPLLITLGLGAERTVANAVAGGLVSYVAAAAVVVAMVAALGGLRFLRGFDRQAGRWFLVSGFFVSVSQLLLYMALALAPVSVIVPLQRLSVVFRVIFSGLLNRNAEILDRYVLLAILMSVLGAMCISLDTGFLRGALPWPEAAAELLLQPLGAGWTEGAAGAQQGREGR